MWNPFVFEDINYLIKVADGTEVKILLTDFKKLWVQELAHDAIIVNFQELNPLFIGSDDEILSEALNTIHNVNAVSSLIHEGAECRIEFSSRLSELPIRVGCVLNQDDEEMFYEEVTVPLIKTVQFLELKKNKMGELLVSKDKELLEYNMEFGEISRKNIITKKYEKGSEDKADELMLDVFARTDSFYENFGRKHGDIRKIYPELQEQKSEKKKLTLPKAKRRKL